MRKAKQQSRNLTAADVVAESQHNGKYTTLLEMDAVKQLQLKSRQQKHVRLAWEDAKEADLVNYEDDDVPLGVLFPGQQAKISGGRIGGLLAARELEDNEPLSERRERLTASIAAAKSMRSSYLSSTMGLEQDVDDKYDKETLAERLKRLKAEKTKQDVQKPVTDNTKAGKATSQILEGEETLGQRRQRLRQEAALEQRMYSNGLAAQTHQQQRRQMMCHAPNGIGVPPTYPAGYPQPYGLVPNLAQYPCPYPYPQIPGIGMPFAYPTAMNMPLNPVLQHQMSMNLPYPVGMGLNMNTQTYPNQLTMDEMIGMGPPLDPKQREGIERWRQSVSS